MIYPRLINETLVLFQVCHCHWLGRASDSEFEARVRVSATSFTVARPPYSVTTSTAAGVTRTVDITLPYGALRHYVDIRGVMVPGASLSAFKFELATQLKHSRHGGAPSKRGSSCRRRRCSRSRRRRIGAPPLRRLPARRTRGLGPFRPQTSLAGHNCGHGGLGLPRRAGCGAAVRVSAVGRREGGRCRWGQPRDIDLFPKLFLMNIF